MQEVAKTTGVSRTAVSFILSGRGEAHGISAATADRVRAAAEAMGYRRNEMARAMQTGRSQMIGLLTWHTASEQFGMMLSGLMQGAQEGGYSLKMLSGGDALDENVRRLIEMRVAGVVLMQSQNDDVMAKLRAELDRYQLPLVALDAARGAGYGSVRSDDRAGMRSVVAHLLELGHREIGYLGAPYAGSRVGAPRRDYVLDAVRELAPEVAVRASPATLDGLDACEAQARALLSGANRPSALICATDSAALLACRAAHALGLRVPHDVSVSGYAGLSIGELGDPPLTTVHQPFVEMGREAARLILQTPAQLIDARLPTRLIARQSTGPLL